PPYQRCYARWMRSSRTSTRLTPLKLKSSSLRYVGGSAPVRWMTVPSDSCTFWLKATPLIVRPLRFTFPRCFGQNPPEPLQVHRVANLHRARCGTSEPAQTVQFHRVLPRQSSARSSARGRFHHLAVLHHDVAHRLHHLAAQLHGPGVGLASHPPHHPAVHHSATHHAHHRACVSCGCLSSYCSSRSAASPTRSATGSSARNPGSPRRAPGVRCGSNDRIRRVRG